MEEIIKDFLWDMTAEAYPNPIRKAKELTKLINKHLKKQLFIQRVSQRGELLLDYTKQLKKQGTLTSGQDESKLVNKYLSNNCG